MRCFFVSDLHGKPDRYQKLFNQVKKDLPDILFMGGDLFPNFHTMLNKAYSDYIHDYLIPQFSFSDHEVALSPGCPPPSQSPE